MSVGKRLRRLRQSAGLTQRELALPRYTHAYVSTIEAGRRTPSRAAIEYFAEKLSVGVDELLTGRPPDLMARLEFEIQEARRAASASRMEEAHAAFDRIIKEARRYGVHRIQARAEEGRAVCSEHSGDLDEAIARYDVAQEILKNDVVTARVDAIAGKARCLLYKGEQRHAIYILEQALEAMEQEGLSDPGALLRIQASLVAAYFEVGAYTKASIAAEEALRLVPETRDPDRLGSMYINVARVLLADGRADDAYEALRKAESLYRELDLRVEIGRCHLAQGFLLSRQGKLEEATIELAAARDVFSEIDSPINEARVMIELARVKRVAGEVEAAKPLLEQAVMLLHEKDVTDVAEARRVLGEAESDSDPKSAEKNLRLAAELFEQAQEHVQFAATTRALGDLLRSQGDVEGAVEAYRQGILAVEQQL